MLEGEISYQSLQSLDQLMGNMLVEFDARGLLRRSAIQNTVDPEPETALAFPGKVLADGPGNRLFIADTNNHLIRVADLVAAQVWTLDVSGV